jgi:hypothetical protein
MLSIKHYLRDQPNLEELNNGLKSEILEQIWACLGVDGVDHNTEYP